MKRILFGNIGSPNGYGLRISQPAVDVTANTDQQKFYFNSDWPALMPLYMSGTVSLAANTLATVNFAASLGYFPMCSIFYSPDNANYEALTYNADMSYSPVATDVLASEGGTTPLYATLFVKIYADKLTFLSSAACYCKYYVYKIAGATS